MVDNTQSKLIPPHPVPEENTVVDEFMGAVYE